jgi:hypothetical protein
MSGITGSFSTYEQDVLDPRAGAEGVAQAIAYGGIQDQEIIALRTAALCRLPMYCPDDGLDQCGQGFVMPRFNGESNDSYRARLIAAFSTYSIAGSPQALIGSLQAWSPGLQVFVLPVWQSPAPFWPEPTPTTVTVNGVSITITYNYAEYYVFLGPTFGASGIGPTIVGSMVVGDCLVGSTMTASQYQQIKAQVLGRGIKYAGGYPIKMILMFSGTSGSPTTALDSSTTATYPIGRVIGDTMAPVGDPTCVVGGYY